MSKFYSTEEKFTFNGVLIVPRYSDVPSRSTDYVDTSVTMGSHRFKIPIIAANMHTVCGVKMARKMASLGGLGIVHRHMSVGETEDILKNQWSDMWLDHPLALAVGSIRNPLEKQRIECILKSPQRTWTDDQIILCVDIAHGDSVHMRNTVMALRGQYGFSGTIIAGNVVTSKSTKNLSDWGSTIVKVGIGGGSGCSTRIKTGCGYPQLSAVLDCAESGIPIISDGGHKQPQDVVKSLAAGADFVMLGGMLAGTDGTPAWDSAYNSWTSDPDAPDHFTIEYAGMASESAKKSFFGFSKDVEGASFKVRGRPVGSTESVVNNIMEGVRSAMTYVGAMNLNEFYKNSQFVKVSHSAISENHPHFGE